MLSCALHKLRMQEEEEEEEDREAHRNNSESPGGSGASGVFDAAGNHATAACTHVLKRLLGVIVAVAVAVVVSTFRSLFYNKTVAGATARTGTGCCCLSRVS